MIRDLLRKLIHYPYNNYYDAGYDTIRNMLRSGHVHPQVMLVSIESHEEHEKTHMRIFGAGMRAAWNKLGGPQRLYEAQTVQADNPLSTPPL